MKLHLNQQLFQEAVRYTAQEKRIQPEYIEKDYWVCFALFTLFNHKIGEDVVFKGGTALSKCYKMIERFSEDIDLSVLRKEGETDNQLKTKLKIINEIISGVLPEINIEGLTRKMGMNRKTAHDYHKVYSGNYGQVRDMIILESTWFGYYEPFTQKNIVSFVGEMMVQNGQSDLAKEFDLLPFEIRVLEPIRTLCEKIMSLVRFSYTERPTEDLKNKVRHIYDLHQLLQQKEFLDFFISMAFDKMLLKVANDDVMSFRNNNQWLQYHPKEALIFKDVEQIWNSIKTVYMVNFRNLVFGELPNPEAILETLKMIKSRIEKVDWVLNLES